MFLKKVSVQYFPLCKYNFYYILFKSPPRRKNGYDEAEAYIKFIKFH